MLVGLGLQRIGIGGERGLGVDDHILALGEMDDDVRTHIGLLFATHHALLLKLHALTQSAFFQDLLQHTFAPVAMYLTAVLQRVGQGIGTLGRQVGLLEQFFDACFHRGLQLDLLLLVLIHARAHVLQVLLERTEQHVQSFLARLRELLLTLTQDILGLVLQLLLDALQRLGMQTVGILLGTFLGLLLLTQHLVVALPLTLLGLGIAMLSFRQLTSCIFTCLTYISALQHIYRHARQHGSSDKCKN